ncbi:MAG: hypothetical protein ACXVLO_08320 [Acidimicrobiia bacterium]
MRRSVVAAVGLALVVALGACGDSTADRATTSKVSTIRLVSQAADAAAEARTARMSGQMDVSIAGSEQSMPIRGAVDFTSNSASIVVDVSKLGGGVLSGSMEMRVVDGTMYMNMGALFGARADALLHGKDWVSVDLASMGAQGGGQNPADMLQSLRGAGSVREVGEDEIDGVSTRHFRADIDVEKAIAKVPAKYRDLAEQGMKALGRSYPVDVWIDGQGRPRRFAVDITVAGKARVEEAIDYSDFGADVSISPPPADQVMSLDEFQRLASSGANPTA